MTAEGWTLIVVFTGPGRADCASHGPLPDRRVRRDGAPGFRLFCRPWKTASTALRGIRHGAEQD